MTQYAVYLADFPGTFHDLRSEAGKPDQLLTAWIRRAMWHRRKLTAELMEHGSIRVVYPSVRRPGGTRIACFRPSVVAKPRKGNRFRLTGAPNRASLVREGL